MQQGKVYALEGISDMLAPSMQGKYAAMIVCWLLGIGCLFSWNSMLTIEDYYVYIFPVFPFSICCDFLLVSACFGSFHIAVLLMLYFGCVTSQLLKNWR